MLGRDEAAAQTEASACGRPTSGVFADQMTEQRALAVVAARERLCCAYSQGPPRREISTLAKPLFCAALQPTAPPCVQVSRSQASPTDAPRSVWSPHRFAAFALVCSASSRPSSLLLQEQTAATTAQCASTFTAVAATTSTRCAEGCAPCLCHHTLHHRSALHPHSSALQACRPQSPLLPAPQNPHFTCSHTQPCWLLSLRLLCSPTAQMLRSPTM